MINQDVVLTSTSFDGKHTIELNPVTHIYKLDGKRVPGSTTVGATYPKGEGLIKWLIKQGIEEYESKKKLTQAAEIGKLVHHYSYCAALKLPFDWALVDASDDAATIRECIRQFDDWHFKHPEDEICFVESVVGLPEYMVGGQIDKVVKRGDKVIVRDYKTSKKVYISALHQVALYKIMLKVWHNVDVDELEILKFSKDSETSKFEWAVVSADAIDINGHRIEIPGVMAALEDQALRNIKTYRHTHQVEKKLLDYYDPRKQWARK